MTHRTRTLLKAAVGLGCLTGLCLFAYYGVHVKARKEARVRRDAGLIFQQLDKEQVAWLVVEYQDKRTRAEKTGVDKNQFPTWSIVAPVKTEGDNISINSLLGTIERLESKRTLEDSREVDRKSYGLDPPRAKVVLKTQAEKSYGLLVGTKSAFNDMLYVQREGDSDIHLVNGYLEKSLLMTPFELRRKELLQFDRKQATRLILRRGEKSIELKKEQDSWNILSPIRDQAESSEVDKLLAGLGSLRATSFRDTSKTPLAYYGLDPAMVEVEVSLGQERHTLRMGKSDVRPGQTRYYAHRISPPGPVAEIQEHHLKHFQCEPSELRARTIVEFNEEEVFKIKSASEKELVVLERSQEVEESWSLVSPKAAPAKKAAIDGMLQNLNDLSATGFFGDKNQVDLSAFGLDRPLRTVTLFDREGKELAGLKIGKSSDKGTYVTGTTRVQVCRVAKQTLDRLSFKVQDLLDPAPEQPQENP